MPSKSPANQAIAILKSSSSNNNNDGQTTENSRPRRRTLSPRPSLVLCRASWGKHLIEEIFRLFDKHDIPAMLWGDVALKPYGVRCLEEVFTEMLFVVDDEDLEDATDVLSKSGLKECEYEHSIGLGLSWECSHVKYGFLNDVKPSIHLRHGCGANVGLCTLSSVCLQGSDLRTEPFVWENIMHQVTRPSLDPSGEKRKEEFVEIRVPNPEMLCEAYALLGFKESNPRKSRIWINRLWIIAEYIDDNGRGNLVDGRLSDDARDLYSTIVNGQSTLHNMLRKGRASSARRRRPKSSSSARAQPYSLDAKSASRQPRTNMSLSDPIKYRL